MKSIHDSGEVVLISKRVPRSKKAMARPSSERSSAQPMEWRQKRHLPLKASQEIIGRLSYHLSCLWQWRQRDREERSLDLCVVL